MLNEVRYRPRISDPFSLHPRISDSLPPADQNLHSCVNVCMMCVHGGVCGVPCGVCECMCMCVCVYVCMFVCNSCVQKLILAKLGSCDCTWFHPTYD